MLEAILSSPFSIPRVKMLQKKAVFGMAMLLSLCFVLQDSVSAKILFEDDFEAETLGEEPSKWVYDPMGEIKDIAQIIEDPVEGDKCMSHYGFYLVGDETWTDYIVEWDWMRMDINLNESVNFRYQDSGHFYHLTPRGGGAIIVLYRYDGAYTELAEANWSQEAQIWYRCQLIANQDKFSIKIKEKSDKTPFNNLEALLEAGDENFTDGGFSTGFYGPIDDVIITDLAGAAVVKSSYSLPEAWGAIKIEH